MTMVKEFTTAADGFVGARLLLDLGIQNNSNGLDRLGCFEITFFDKKESTPAGLEPTRDKPNRFLVDRLNRSATVSC